MEGNTRLERSVLLFNGLSQWVQLMVLSKTTAKQRATIIAKFIKVSQVCNWLLAPTLIIFYYLEL